MNLVELSNDFSLNYLACIRRTASEFKLSLSQSLCLQSIPFDGISQSQLAKKLSIDISTLSRNINHLISLDIVSKKHYRIDRRSYQICLTAHGQNLYTRFNQSLNEQLKSVYESLDYIEKDQMSEILNKINWQLEIINK